MTNTIVSVAINLGNAMINILEALFRVQKHTFFAAYNRTIHHGICNTLHLCSNIAIWLSMEMAAILFIIPLAALILARRIIEEVRNTNWLSSDIKEHGDQTSTPS
jgi:hypothetical protein